MPQENKFASLYEYWCTIKGPNIMPDAKQFSPARLKGILTHLVIIERCSYSEGFGLRLCGSSIERHVGRALTGTSFSDLFAYSAKTRGSDGMHRDFDALFSAPAGLVGERAWFSGEETHVCSFIFLPLGGDGACKKFVGQLEFQPRLSLTETETFDGFGDMLHLEVIDLGQPLAGQMLQMPRAKLAA